MSDHELGAMDLLVHTHQIYERMLTDALDGGGTLHMDDIVASVAQGVPAGSFAPTQDERSRLAAIEVMVHTAIAASLERDLVPARQATHP